MLGLKSHWFSYVDATTFILVCSGLLPKGPRHAIYRLCSYFNRLCQRIIDKEVMLEPEKEVVDILCLFKRYFPISFLFFWYNDTFGNSFKLYGSTYLLYFPFLYFKCNTLTFILHSWKAYINQYIPSLFTFFLSLIYCSSCCSVISSLSSW